jgi:NAD(P)-dependent dehydrogenase (short-subunit alcohol dehydrogenase family)
VLPHFRERKSGTVVFIGSSGGLGGEPGAGPVSQVLSSRTMTELIPSKYCSTKFALEGWYECLKQETAQFGIKSIIFEPGLFRTKMMDAKNIKFRQDSIADYDDLRNIVKQYVQGLTGNQPGDAKKAVEIMVDVVRGEGAAEGKELPQRLPLGPDCLALMRKIAVGNLAICNEWEDVIRSTNHD